MITVAKTLLHSRSLGTVEAEGHQGSSLQRLVDGMYIENESVFLRLRARPTLKVGDVSKSYTQSEAVKYCRSSGIVGQHSAKQCPAYEAWLVQIRTKDVERYIRWCGWSAGAFRGCDLFCSFVYAPASENEALEVVVGTPDAMLSGEHSHCDKSRVAINAKVLVSVGYPDAGPWKLPMQFC